MKTLFQDNLNRYLAEMIGTFALVFFGCGAIVVNEISGGSLGHIGVSSAFGLIVMVMIYSVGNISGAHINPAVTLGFFVARRLPALQVPFYVVSQFVGAIGASFLLTSIMPRSNSYGETFPSGGVLPSFFLEIILSFFLMFVILNVSTGHMEKGIMAGVAIGGTIALEALVGGPISGASMNPARSLAPALFSGNLSSLWIYLTAPFIGAVAASPTCRIIQREECCDREIP